jgi:hypothetical protein
MESNHLGRSGWRTGLQRVALWRRIQCARVGSASRAAQGVRPRVALRQRWHRHAQAARGFSLSQTHPSRSCHAQRLAAFSVLIANLASTHHYLLDPRANNSCHAHRHAEAAGTALVLAQTLAGIPPVGDQEGLVAEGHGRSDEVRGSAARRLHGRAQHQPALAHRAGRPVRQPHVTSPCMRAGRCTGRP